MCVRVYGAAWCMLSVCLYSVLSCEKKEWRCVHDGMRKKKWCMYVCVMGSVVTNYMKFVLSPPQGSDEEVDRHSKKKKRSPSVSYGEWIDG